MFFRLKISAIDLLDLLLAPVILLFIYNIYIYVLSNKSKRMWKTIFKSVSLQHVIKYCNDPNVIKN